MNSQLYEQIVQQYLEQDESLPKHIAYDTDLTNTVNYNGTDTFGKRFGSLYVIAVPSSNGISYTHLFKIRGEESTHFILDQIL